MSHGTRCPCPRCTVGGLMWPVLLITAGALFLPAQLGWGYTFGDLWPVLLIVIGAVKVIEALAPTTGHLGP